MTLIFHNPPTVPDPHGGYAHAVEVQSGARLLFISGQIPGAENGAAPPTFEYQCRAVWEHIIALLESAGMTTHDLVKVTTFLTHADQVEINGQIRREILGDHTPALTVIIAATLQSNWMLEIEAIAAV